MSPHSAIASSKVQVQWVSSARDIDKDLWKKCWPTSVEGVWWYELLEDSKLEAQFTFRYGLVQKGGVPVGILPAFVMDVPLELVMPPAVVALLKTFQPLFPQVGYQRTLFIGSPCADEGTIGFLPEANLRAIAPTLQREVAALAKKLKAPMIVWKDLPTATLAELESAAKSENMFKMISYPGTVADLPKDNFKGYMAMLKTSRRYQLNKKLKKSHATSQLSTEVIQNPDPAALQEIFGLFTQTYEKATTKFERLGPEFFENVARLPNAHFVVLRDTTDGKMVAFMLCFHLGDLIINKFIGIDYHRPKDWFLYFRLWEAAASWAISEGAAQLQSGQTGYRPKVDVGHSLIPLYNLCKHSNPIIHKVYASIGKTITCGSLDEDLAVYFEAHPECDITIPESGSF